MGKPSNQKYARNKIFCQANLMQKHNAYIVTKQIINIYSQWSLE